MINKGDGMKTAFTLQMMGRFCAFKSKVKYEEWKDEGDEIICELCHNIKRVNVMVKEVYYYD